MRRGLRSGLLTTLCAGSMLFGGCGRRGSDRTVLDVDRGVGAEKSASFDVFVCESRANVSFFNNIPTKELVRSLKPKNINHNFSGKKIYFLERDGGDLRDVVIFDSYNGDKREIRSESAMLAGDDVVLSLILKGARISSGNSVYSANEIRYDLYDFSVYKEPLRVNQATDINVFGENAKFESVCFFNNNDLSDLKVFVSTGISDFDSSSVNLNFGNSCVYMALPSSISSLEKLCFGIRREDVPPVSDRERKGVFKIIRDNSVFVSVIDEGDAVVYRMPFDTPVKSGNSNGVGVANYFGYKRNPTSDRLMAMVVGNFEFVDKDSGKKQRVVSCSSYSNKGFSADDLFFNGKDVRAYSAAEVDGVRKGYAFLRAVPGVKELDVLFGGFYITSSFGITDDDKLGINLMGGYGNADFRSRSWLDFEKSRLYLVSSRELSSLRYDKGSRDFVPECDESNANRILKMIGGNPGWESFFGRDSRVYLVYNGNLAEGFGSKVFSAERHNGEMLRLDGLNHYLQFSIQKDERGLSLGTVGELAYRTKCHNGDIDLTVLCSKQIIAPVMKK